MSESIAGRDSPQDDASHIFQEAVTGGVAEYSQLPLRFIPGYLEVITAWVLGELSEPGP